MKSSPPAPRHRTDAGSTWRAVVSSGHLARATPPLTPPTRPQVDGHSESGGDVEVAQRGDHCPNEADGGHDREEPFMGAPRAFHLSMFTLAPSNHPCIHILQSGRVPRVP